MDFIQKKWFPPVLIVISILIFLGLKSLKKEPIKEQYQVIAPLVKVEHLVPYTGSIKIHGTGAIRSVSEVNLIPQVAGVLQSIGKSAVPGASFNKGDVLFQIEQADYTYRVQAAKAEVARQEVLLKSEEYESEIAKEEWKEYSGESQEKASALALREPQLNMAKANLEAAKANYNMALLNLKRTRIKAPFDGQIKQRFVDVGQYVAPGTALASIFSSEESEIRVGVQPRDIDWIEVGQNVDIVYKQSNWTGKVKTVGTNLDPKSRLATVTVRLNTTTQNEPKLLNGLYVDVYIHGKPVENTFEVDRYLIKNGNELWVLSDGKLNIKEVEVLYHGKHKSYISLNAKANDKLIISTIETPINGMKLRTN